jgi:Cu(I)/Ag(I) efflux system membrane fusion protein
VVTSAQFLIDSESKLNEATAKMIEPSAPQKSQPNRLLMEQGAHQHD